MPQTTVKFVTEVSTEADLDLVDAIDVVHTLLKRMKAEDIILPDGRVVTVTVKVDLQEASTTEARDPLKAFRAGVQEAQDSPLREGLLSPRQFPTDEP